MNGDVGIIKEIIKENKETKLLIDFDGRMVTYGPKLDYLTLAYAISIHKSQGSEYDNVIIPILPSYNIMLRKKIIYTAITRNQEKKLIILGEYNAINQAIHSKDDVRQTSLSERFQIKKADVSQEIEIDDPLSAYKNIR
ncbi:MAG: ATP-dependent RecD-like DNA helicase [Clostridium sp.]|nr:MAG: ATP-dependent RecD-like DNA helicase [Clostridium sp.]